MLVLQAARRFETTLLTISPGLRRFSPQPESTNF